MVLIANTDLLGIFSLARGYGLSIGFMWIAMFHFSASIGEGRPLQLIQFHLASILAVLSSFTQLDFYAAAMISYYPINWAVVSNDHEWRSLISRTWKINAAMLLVSCLVLFGPVSRMLQGNQLDFGGKTGFWDSTVRTIIYSTAAGFTVTPQNFHLYQIAVGLIVLMGSIVVYIQLRRT
ncbi:MAG: hypothetical protein KDC03_05065, partial [Flavobacteriales bacterium]|nr:hypothetical protein [Flavobacteriales bacterium]